MHIHMGIIHALVIFANVIIVGFFWRIVAAHNAANSVGQAMSFLF